MTDITDIHVYTITHYNYSKKWDAVLINTKTGKQFYTSDLENSSGYTYKELQQVIKKYFNITIPAAQKLQILDKRSRFTIYAVNKSFTKTYPICK